MDRFIVYCYVSLFACPWYLKSNMDRFIGNAVLSAYVGIGYLKSNMDRFIGCQNMQKFYKYSI